MKEQIACSRSILDSGASPGQVSESEGRQGVVTSQQLGCGVPTLAQRPTPGFCSSLLQPLPASSPSLRGKSLPARHLSSGRIVQGPWVSKADRTPAWRPVHHGTSNGARSEQSQRDPELWEVIWEAITGKGCPAEGRVNARALRQEHNWRVRSRAKSPMRLEQRKAQGWAGHAGPLSCCEDLMLL